MEKACTIRCAGYEEVALKIPRGEKTARVRLTPIGESVSVTFSSEPKGADVILDGRKIGVTPLTANVLWMPEDKPKQVTMLKEGYKLATPIQLERARRQVTVDLLEVITTTALQVRVEPPGAQIEIDDAPVGVAPCELALRWSVRSLTQHRVRVTYPGYTSETRTVNRGEPELKVRLVPTLPAIP